MKRLLCALMLCVTVSLHAAEDSDGRGEKRKKHPQEEKERQPKKLQSFSASPPLTAIPISSARAISPSPTPPLVTASLNFAPTDPSVFPPPIPFLLDSAHITHLSFTSMMVDIEQLKQRVAVLENRGPLANPVFDHTAIQKRLDSLAASIKLLQKDKNAQNTRLKNLSISAQEQESHRKRIKILEGELDSLVRKASVDATRIESVEKTVADARREAATHVPEIPTPSAPSFANALKGHDMVLPMLSMEEPHEEGHYE